MKKLLILVDSQVDFISSPMTEKEKLLAMTKLLIISDSLVTFPKDDKVPVIPIDNSVNLNSYPKHCFIGLQS